MERRLTTILAADVVGYSALMERDEAGTFERLRAHQKELIEPEIRKYHGRIFKLMGDGFLAEFASAADAVECAVALQQVMQHRNSGRKSDDRIEFRIGINLGDVIIDGEDRHGDGVNVAARLEGIARPGGVCVSAKVQKEVRGKLGLQFEDIGEVSLKNIAKPIHAFHIVRLQLADELAVVDGMFERGTWSAAFDLLSGLDARYKLNGHALETFATAAYMIGRETTFSELLERAFEALCAEAEPLKAARSAFWIGLTLMFRGEFGRGSGWLARSERLVDEHGNDCVEQGYILLPRVTGSLASGDLAAADHYASEAVRIGGQFRDEDLLAIARHFKGRIRIESGNTPEGLSLLDETMIAVTQGRLSPIVTGLIYCSVIEICQNFQIQRRAKEWTEALSGWCGSQPELVAFTGRCLIHRSEILIFDGKWTEAFAEAGAACRRLLAGPVEHHAGPAFYQEGEVLRLSGRFDEADESYRSASRLGFDPQPGLALMRLRQGKSQAALSSIKRTLASVRDPVGRMRLLPAAVEIILAAGDIETARDLCAELSGFAARYVSDAVDAASAEAIGDLSFAERKLEEALPGYGRAAELWRDLHAPYRLSRLRLKIGQACAALGDSEGARREVEAARDVFDKLGAEPDRRAAEAMLHSLRQGKERLLTPRQTEVLQLVAEGLTNCEIAERLGLSERTVDRHVSDTLTRIDAPTRAAAVAFAISHGLIVLRPAG